MSFDYANFALKSICPNNRIIFDDKEMPSVFVYVPKFRLCDVLSTDDTRIHPAFVVKGTEIDGFWCGKFQSICYNERAYSLPGEEPYYWGFPHEWTAYNRAKGGNFHEITNAEWAAIALWCHKNGTEPYGNNDNGKDSRESVYKAVQKTTNNGKTELVATGTGPVSWSHDGTLAGIWDLNGNKPEHCNGVRLVKGELQVLKDNDAAAPDADLSESSSAWKAIKANATSWSDIYLTPNGSGTTSGSVKLDYISNEWVWSTSISSPTNSTRGGIFKNTTADSSVGNIAKKLLMAQALLPDTSLTGTGIDADYGNDMFMARNGSAEDGIVLASRGGGYDRQANGGVFCLEMYKGRTSNPNAGRSAFIGQF